MKDEEICDVYCDRETNRCKMIMAGRTCKEFDDLKKLAAAAEASVKKEMIEKFHKERVQLFDSITAHKKEIARCKKTTEASVRAEYQAKTLAMIQEIESQLISFDQQEHTACFRMSSNKACDTWQALKAKYSREVK